MALADSIIRELRTYFLSLDRQNVVTGSILPSADGTYRLGSPTKKWHAIYADRVIADNLEGAAGGGSGSHADTLGVDYVTATESPVVGNLYPLQDDGSGNPVFPASILPDDVAYENSTPTFTSINVTNYVDGIDVGSHTHSGAANMGQQISHANLTQLSADHHSIYTRWDDTETVIKKWKFSNQADENQDFNEYVGWELEASVVLEDIAGTYYPVMSTAQAVLQTLSFTDPTYSSYEHSYPLQLIAHAQYASLTMGSASEILIKTDSTDTWIDVGNIELSNTNGISVGATFSVTQAGALTSTSGSIGGWSINSDDLRSSTDDVILDKDGFIQLSGGGDNEVRMSAIHADYRLWIGAEEETTWDETTAKFIVNPSGQMTAESVFIKGGIQSYTAGKWNITSDGHAEFESITARGRLDTLVFTKSAVSSVAGIIALSNGAVLADDITDSTTTIYLDAPEFGFGDIVLLQPEADMIEWMLIVSTYTQTTIQDAEGNDKTVYQYTVSRDFDETGNSYAFEEGTAVNGRGSYSAGNDPLPLASGDAQGAFGDYQPSGTYAGAGGGWITLDGESALIEVDVRTGPLPDQYQEFIRIGNLQGILTYDAIEWGFFIGDENNYMVYDQTNGLNIYTRDGGTTINSDGITSDAFILSLETVEPTSVDTDTAVLYYYNDLIKVRWDDTGSETLDILAFQSWVTDNSINDISEDTTPTLGGALDANNKAISGVDTFVFYDGGSTVDIIRDEDNLTSDDAAALATQQSIKAYVDDYRPIDVVIPLTNNNTTLVTGDDFAEFVFVVPALLDGYDLGVPFAANETPSTSGIPTFQIHNVTDAVDMLSTKLTIDANEQNSSTAATAAVVNATYQEVATGDRIRFDCDVAGTGCKGITLHLPFTNT